MTKKHRDIWISPSKPKRLYIKNTVPDEILQQLLSIPAEEIVVTTPITQIEYSSHRRAHTAAGWARKKIQELESSYE
jgi:hypothetical protein